MLSFAQPFPAVLLVTVQPSGDARAWSAESGSNLAAAMASIIEQDGMEAAGLAIGSAALGLLHKP